MGFVDDLAAAIALAATDPRAAGRTSNVGEPLAPTQQEWIGRLGAVVGWTRAVVVAPAERRPPHLLLDRDCRQDWVVARTRIRGELGFAEPTAPTTRCGRRRLGSSPTRRRGRMRRLSLTLPKIGAGDPCRASRVERATPRGAPPAPPRQR